MKKVFWKFVFFKFIFLIKVKRTIPKTKLPFQGIGDFENFAFWFCSPGCFDVLKLQKLLQLFTWEYPFFRISFPFSEMNIFLHFWKVYNVFWLIFQILVHIKLACWNITIIFSNKMFVAVFETFQEIENWKSVVSYYQNYSPKTFGNQTC